MSPTAVCIFVPPRPGDVPNTTLPPEYSWLTGVTSEDSPPRMLSTHTRSLRVAIWASELMPTKNLKSPIPFLYIEFAFLAMRPRQRRQPARSSWARATWARPDCFIHSSAVRA